jgi:hypothetical protein
MPICRAIPVATIWSVIDRVRAYPHLQQPSYVAQSPLGTTYNCSEGRIPSYAPHQTRMEDVRQNVTGWDGRDYAEDKHGSSHHCHEQATYGVPMTSHFQHRNQTVYAPSDVQGQGCRNCNEARPSSSSDHHGQIGYISPMLNHGQCQRQAEYGQQARTGEDSGRSHENGHCASPYCSIEPRYGAPTHSPQYGRGHHYKREVRPETYNGKSEWGDFICHFDRVASWNDWSPPEKARQLAMCLRAPASYQLTGLSNAILSDYQWLTASLGQRFSPEERQLSARCEFRNRTRQHNEKATDFMTELQRQAAKGWPNFGPETCDAMVMEQFIAGLGDESIRKHVVFGHARTLPAAVSLAEEYDAFAGLSFGSKQARKPATTAVIWNDSSEEVVCAIPRGKDLKAGLRPQSSSQTPQTNKAQTKPEDNDLAGLVKEELAKMRQWVEAQVSDMKQARRPRIPMEQVICYRCGEKGHFERNCRSERTKTGSQDARASN